MAKTEARPNGATAIVSGSARGVEGLKTHVGLQADGFFYFECVGTKQPSPEEGCVFARHFTIDEKMARTARQKFEGQKEPLSVVT